MFLYIPMIIGVCIFIYLRLTESKKMATITQGYLDARAFKRALREESLTRGKISSLLLLNTVLVCCTGITYLAHKKMNIALDAQFITFGVCAIGIILYFWIRRIALWLIGYFTDQKTVIHEIQVYNKFYYQFLGLAILPVLFLLNFKLTSSDVYWKAFFYNGATILLILMFIATYILKVIQEFRQTRQLKVSGYYLFLYFCTLEILPLVVIFTWLMG